MIFLTFLLGVKACEFLADKHKVPHTQVDNKTGHYWAFCLAKQEKAVTADPTFMKEMEFYPKFKDIPCPRFTIATQKPCGISTCIQAAAKAGQAWE